MSANGLRIAAAPYAVGRAQGWDDFAARVHGYAARAANEGARILVLPEYAALDLGVNQPDAVRGDLAASCGALQAVLPDYRAFHSELARTRGLWVVAGTFPVALDSGGYANRAYIYSPGGIEHVQDKLLLTRYERMSGVFRAGSGLRVFEADFGRFGVNVCYDSEFPLLARAQAEAGATLLLVPSCTDTPQGASRVRIGCQARALENQVAVLQVPLLGEAPWSPCVDVNVGAAALYGPPDVGMPANGILAEGGWNDDGLLVVEVPLQRIQSLRRHGHVANYADWPAQAGQSIELIPAE